MAWDDEDGSEGEDSSDSGTTAPCPHCRADIYDDAERCPACGNYPSAEDAPRAGWPAWMWIAAALALVVCALMAGVQLIPRLFR
ncbi:MAG: zinc ribbon domain-containing protein [Planctomycetota bacterium]